MSWRIVGSVGLSLGLAINERKPYAWNCRQSPQSLLSGTWSGGANGTSSCRLDCLRHTVCSIYKRQAARLFHPHVVGYKNNLMSKNATKLDIRGGKVTKVEEATEIALLRCYKEMIGFLFEGGVPDGLAFQPNKARRGVSGTASRGGCVHTLHSFRF